jgi:pimeloyl-ACP methyl ester carboxylesterase
VWVWRAAAASALIAAMSPACAPAQSTLPPLPPWSSEGQRIWVDAPDGRLKTRAYASARTTDHPVLLVWLHGDLDPGAEHFVMAQLFAHVTENVIAVAITRPGYADAEGDVSAGRKGYAVGDNYTAAVADDIDAAVRQLKARFRPRAVVLMGHSGGAGNVANVLGRHPDDADAAVLIACSCDPREFMIRWKARNPEVPKDLPNPSLQPLDVVDGVSRRVHVRMIIGSRDDVVRLEPSQAYAAALKARGIDVRLDIAPGADHVSVLDTDQTRQATAEVLAMEGAKVLSP